MQNRKKLLCLAAGLLAAAVLAGCTTESSAGGTDASQEEPQTITVTEADPQRAVDEIYAELPEAQTQELTWELLGQKFPDLTGKVTECYGKLSSPNGGLADVIILRPAEDAEDAVATNRSAVHDALLSYQEERISEFETYDILDAYSISKGAEVFSQGDYVILLMLPDNEAARAIVDTCLPL